MREPVTKRIDDESYTFHQLNPKKSLKLLVRIFRMVGAPMGAAMTGTAVESDNSKSAGTLEQEMDITAVVSALCDRLDENEVEAIIDELLSQAIHDGHGEVSKAFDVLFGGRLPHLFKVVMAAVQVEYSDFFGEKPVFQNLMATAGMNRA